MPRPQRLQLAGFLHHVISVGNDMQVIFKDDQDYNKYLNLLDEARDKFGLKIYNYTLLPNQVNLLVEPQQDQSLSKAMEHVKKFYARYFNVKYERKGHVFGGRFKSYVVQDTTHYFICSRYIDLLAVKENVTTKPDQYKWSGFSSLSTEAKSIIKLDKHKLYMALSKNEYERFISYRALINNYHGPDLDLLNMRSGALGDKDFKEEFKKKR